MIEQVKYRSTLTKLFRQKEALRGAFAEDIRKAQKEGKSREEIQSLEHQSHFEENMVDEEISILVGIGVSPGIRTLHVGVDLSCCGYGKNSTS